MENRCYGCLLGLAIGDALGVTDEMFIRESMDIESIRRMVNIRRQEIHDIPIQMRGGGPWIEQGLILEPGVWTDDTSMALSLADSLIENKRYDNDTTIKYYLQWYRYGLNACCDGVIDKDGKLYGRPIGIGGTIKNALEAYERGDKLQENPHNAGNGCIMRIAPIAIFYRDDMLTGLKAAKDQARATHLCVEAEDCSIAMVYMMISAINGKDKKEILEFPEDINIQIHPAIKEMLSYTAPWKKKRFEELISLPGRSIWSLECTLWIIYHTNSFEEAATMAVRLAGDCDTVSAITLQICGAIYGETSIPKELLESVKFKKYIRKKVKILLG